MIIITKSLKKKTITIFNDTSKKTIRFVLDLTSKPVLQCKNRLKNKFECKIVCGVNSRIDPNLSKLDRGTAGFPNLICVRKVNRRGDRLQIPCAEVVRDQNYLSTISSSFYNKLLGRKKEPVNIITMLIMIPWKNKQTNNNPHILLLNARPHKELLSAYLRLRTSQMF